MTSKMLDRFSSVAILALSALAGSIACGGSSDAPSAPDRNEPDDPPAVAITSPADESTVSGTVDVTADASDDSGVSQVEFFVDGGSIGADSDGSDGWSASWDTERLADGSSHDVSARATDDVGQTASDEVSVTVDNVDDPPSPTPDVDGEWTQMASMGGVARDRALAFSIGDRGYVGLGQGTVSGTFQDFWEYNPATDTWTQKADFAGGPRHSAGGFSIGDRGYAGTGFSADETGDGKPLKDFYEYDPETNSWTRVADFGGSARFGAVGFSIGEKGYIGTGKEKLTGGHVSDFWEYDPSTDTWTSKASVPGPPRQHGVGFSIGDRGYIGLGWSSGHDEAFRDFYEYDPSTDSWVRKADLGGFGRVWAAGFSAGGKGYVGTGNRGRPRPQVGPDKLNDFWEYDPETDTWAERADFVGSPRHATTGFSIGERGYIGTGWDGDRHHRDLWEFTPPSR